MLPTSTPTRRPPEPRVQRLGYDRALWTEAHPSAIDAEGYWPRARRPLSCLAFVLPLIIIYEVGVSTAGVAGRTGADAWVREAMARVGLTDRWLPPLALVGGLLAWQAIARKPWGVSPRCLLGMLAESLVYGIGLIGLGELADRGFDRIEGLKGPLSPVLSADTRVASLVGYVGAGVYEEALFRLALIPSIYGLARLMQAPRLLASTLAVTASALLFSAAHHAGAPGEAFTWFAFSFRWLAGVYFAWVFLARGFGVAVGTHAAYDILVGGFGWHL